MTDKFIIILSEKLLKNRCKNITKITISSCNFTDLGLLSFNKVILKLKLKLELLNFNHNLISCKGIQDFAESVITIKCKTLGYINFGYNRIDNVGVNAIS